MPSEKKIQMLKKVKGMVINLVNPRFVHFDKPFLLALVVGSLNFIIFIPVLILLANQESLLTTTSNDVQSVTLTNSMTNVMFALPSYFKTSEDCGGTYYSGQRTTEEGLTKTTAECSNKVCFVNGKILYGVANGGGAPGSIDLMVPTRAELGPNGPGELGYNRLVPSNGWNNGPDTTVSSLSCYLDATWTEGRVPYWYSGAYGNWGYLSPDEAGIERTTTTTTQPKPRLLQTAEGLPEMVMFEQVAAVVESPLTVAQRARAWDSNDPIHECTVADERDLETSLAGGGASCPVKNYIESWKAFYQCCQVKPATNQSGLMNMLNPADQTWREHPACARIDTTPQGPINVRFSGWCSQERNIAESIAYLERLSQQPLPKVLEVCEDMVEANEQTKNMGGGKAWYEQSVECTESSLAGGAEGNGDGANDGSDAMGYFVSLQFRVAKTKKLTIATGKPFSAAFAEALAYTAYIEIVVTAFCIIALKGCGVIKTLKEFAWSDMLNEEEEDAMSEAAIEKLVNRKCREEFEGVDKRIAFEVEKQMANSLRQTAQGTNTDTTGIGIPGEMSGP